MYAFFYAMYLANVQAWVYAHSDSSTFMRHADNGLNGSHVIPNIPGC